MTYVSDLNNILKPKSDGKWTVLDLFAGCGGLSLGFEAIGFQTIGYEMDQSATDTYNKNLNGQCFAEKLSFNTQYPQTFDVIVGGPPCQPFSVGGNQKGIDDDRNGFPIFIDVVKKQKPKILLFENVRGMMYTNKWYLDEVIEQLKEIGYKVDYRLFNAVNFGVPQNRERLFVVGFLGSYSFPKPKVSKVTVGDAIGDLIDTIQDENKILNSSMDRYIANYEKASKCINPRDLYLHKPARTLTCRNLAGSTGDMQRVKLSDGRRRRISVKEAARLQSFPDWFEFSGKETSQYNQIGNAVPPLLAYSLAASIWEYLNDPSNIASQFTSHSRPKYEQLSIFH